MRSDRRGSSDADYEWLKTRIDEREYLLPAYYAQLLKPYTTGERSDLSLLEEFLRGEVEPPRYVLELGSGSGRATAVPLALWRDFDLTACDLSESMLAALPSDARVRRVQSDICDFLLRSPVEREYGLIFSLWAFSHSVHLWLSREFDGAAPKGYTKRAIETMFTRRLAIGGKFFIIHFDSLSAEQSIAMPQWAKVIPIFGTESQKQSPSLRLLLEVLGELADKQELHVDIVHCVGEPIRYRDTDEALETYFNFHLEGRLNALSKEERDRAVDEVRQALAPHRDATGRLAIEPAWFVLSGSRIR